MPLTIVLADDHAGFRGVLKTLLEARGMTVVGEAGDGAEALQLAANHRPDIAVLDLSMPVLSGLDAGLKMRSVSPSTRAILLTMHSEDEYVRQAAAAGIEGYVLKSRAAYDLMDAIRQVARGGSYLSPSLSSAAFQPSAPGRQPSRSAPGRSASLLARLAG
ncbi:MAG: response regulator transcription factor [Acidobacteriia bacterium]|nr:response regulator transcription factor [Terriglobia bacterium]